MPHLLIRQDSLAKTKGQKSAGVADGFTCLVEQAEVPMRLEARTSAVSISSQWLMHFRATHHPEAGEGQ